MQANLTEMKQVLLNLTINALEAVPPVDGEVCVEGRRTRDWVELSRQGQRPGDVPGRPAARVRALLHRPAGNGPGDRGTGLGLSITHAIIESHGGPYPGRKRRRRPRRRFTVRLPAPERDPPAGRGRVRRMDRRAARQQHDRGRPGASQADRTIAPRHPRRPRRVPRDPRRQQRRQPARETPPARTRSRATPRVFTASTGAIKAEANMASTFPIEGITSPRIRQGPLQRTRLVGSQQTRPLKRTLPAPAATIPRPC